MAMSTALQVGLWIALPMLAAVLLFEGSTYLLTHWPKPGEWCGRCRRPLDGDPEVGSICEACEPLGPTKAMRRRAAEREGPRSSLIGDLIPEVLDQIAARSNGDATSATQSDRDEG
jgi:hypothetical protein